MLFGEPAQAPRLPVLSTGGLLGVVWSLLAFALPAAAELGGSSDSVQADQLLILHEPGLVVETGGHMRSFYGRAYVPLWARPTRDHLTGGCPSFSAATFSSLSRARAHPEAPGPTSRIEGKFNP